MIVNKSGQLVFDKLMGNKEYTSNETIGIASTFHAMFAISSTITPKCMQNKDSKLASPVLEGITEIQADTFVIKCLQTQTGLKFMI